MQDTASPQAEKTASEDRFEVFFDGDCPLCRREIDLIRRKDKQNRLILTNVAADDFQLNERPLRVLLKEIHGRFPDGSFVVGVDVFREIYRRLGFARAVWFTSLPLVRESLYAAYFVFARIRFRHAMYRMRERNSRLDQDSCDGTNSSCQQISV